MTGPETLEELKRARAGAQAMLERAEAARESSWADRRESMDGGREVVVGGRRVDRRREEENLFSFDGVSETDEVRVAYGCFGQSWNVRERSRERKGRKGVT